MQSSDRPQNPCSSLKTRVKKIFRRNLLHLMDKFILIANIKVEKEEKSFEGLKSILTTDQDRRDMR